MFQALYPGYCDGKLPTFFRLDSIYRELTDIPGTYYFINRCGTAAKTGKPETTAVNLRTQQSVSECKRVGGGSSVVVRSPAPSVIKESCRTKSPAWLSF